MPWPKAMPSGPGALDVEAVGVVVGPLVAVGGAGDDEHREPGGDRLAVELAVGDGEAALVLRRRLVAQHLLHGGAGERWVGLELGELVGVLGEGHHRVADQLGDRLGAGGGEQHDEAGHLDVGEALDGAVLALDLGLEEVADHVVAEVLALVGGERVHVARRSLMAHSMPWSVGNGLPTSRSSMASVQWRICWRSPSGTPTISQITSTGNGPAKSTTASNELDAVELVEEPVDHPLAPPAPTRRCGAA